MSVVRTSDTAACVQEARSLSAEMLDQDVLLSVLTQLQQLRHRQLQQRESCDSARSEHSRHADTTPTPSDPVDPASKPASRNISRQVSFQPRQGEKQDGGSTAAHHAAEYHGGPVPAGKGGLHPSSAASMHSTPSHTQSGALPPAAPTAHAGGPEPRHQPQPPAHAQAEHADTVSGASWMFDLTAAMPQYSAASGAVGSQGCTSVPQSPLVLTDPVARGDTNAHNVHPLQGTGFLGPSRITSPTLRSPSPQSRSRSPVQRSTRQMAVHCVQNSGVGSDAAQLDLPAWIPNGSGRGTFNKLGMEQAALVTCRRVGLQSASPLKHDSMIARSGECVHAIERF